MTTVTVLNQQNRQGTFVSSSFRVPDIVAEQAIIELTVSEADMTDPTTQVAARLFVSADEGATWSLIAGGTWQGGPNTEKNGATRQWRLIVNDPGRHAGKLVRAELDIATTTRIGARVTV